MSGQKIYLCGFMGCGKTTHGKRLARLIKCEFLDLDAIIESKEGMSITELFKSKGEKYFRDQETEQLKKISTSNSPAVISLGGGAPCFNQNINLILKDGILIYIKMDEKALYKRLVGSIKTRPLLMEKQGKELLDYIKNTITQREQYYNQAHLIIEGKSLKTETILDLIHKGIPSRQID